MDLLSKARRSQNMRQIRSKHTKPELLVRSLAHRMGYRFCLHRESLPGKPDMVFVRHKKIVDIRGCFWHGHKGCIDSHIPKSRIGYWGSKLKSNVKRDVRNLTKLKKLGWKVLIIWECEVMQTDATKLERKLKRFLGSS
jgi:DNA mismatch endonuclease, patch repair protein